MKKFSDYKEERMNESLLDDIITVVKGKFTYYVDKVKKFVLQVTSPADLSHFNQSGVRTAMDGEEFPLKNEVPNRGEVEKTTPIEKNNIKSLIKAATGQSVSVAESAVDGFGEADNMGNKVWPKRMNGEESRNTIADVSQGFVKHFVLSNMMKVSQIKGHSQPVLLFGAPGVGKTSVINTVIRAYNEGRKHNRKGIIAIDCANLGLESLSLVMPAENTTIGAITKAAGLSLSPEEKDSLAKTTVTDMVKEWLPCYRPTGDPALDKKADEIANGRVSVTNGVTLDGGIILLDELLRVQDPGVFGQLMNLILNRQLGDWVVGSKWTFVCLSNRPNDDRMIANALKNAPSAFFNRFAGVYNVEATLDDWATWAMGGSEKESFDFTVQGAAKNHSWRVDPRFVRFVKQNPKALSNIEENEIPIGELVGATPRSWAILSDYLWDIADANNMADWATLALGSAEDRQNLRSTIIGIIGSEWGTPVFEECSKWAKDGPGKGTKPDYALNALDTISKLEAATDRDEQTALLKEFRSIIKNNLSQEEVNANVVSPLIAKWNTETNGIRKSVMTVISKAYPDLTGRIQNYIS